MHWPLSRSVPDSASEGRWTRGERPDSSRRPTDVLRYSIADGLFARDCFPDERVESTGILWAPHRELADAGRSSTTSASLPWTGRRCAPNARTLLGSSLQGCSRNLGGLAVLNVPSRRSAPNARGNERQGPPRSWGDDFYTRANAYCPPLVFTKIAPLLLSNPNRVWASVAS